MKFKTLFLAVMFGLAVLLSGCGPSSTLIPAIPATAPVVAPTEIPPATATSQPTEKPADTPMATVVATPASGARQVSPKDAMEMVYVPAGDFIMGSLSGPVDEQPVHTVTLDGYWIDLTEITNGMYYQCFQAGACLRPYLNGSNTLSYYFSNPKYSNFPVIDLKWESAVKYCTWAGRRLPTEAEWEKAARGTDGRAYPWGDSLPNASLLNFNTPAGDTVGVGKYPKGASQYGALDMAGNVSEWVADWYAADYYAASPKTNPAGPVEGQYKVLRGGSWHSSVYEVRSADRHFVAPDTRNVIIGFRCAMAAP